MKCAKKENGDEKPTRLRKEERKCERRVNVWKDTSEKEGRNKNERGDKMGMRAQRKRKRKKA